MPKIPGKDFEPSGNTKKWWLYTRKARTLHSGVSLPGLFQTARLNLDSIFFVIIIVGELYGLANLRIIGQISYYLFAGLLIADLVFAVCLHIPRGPICEAKNRLVVAGDAGDEAAKWMHEIKRMRWRIITLICSSAIIGIALFKIVSFYALQGGVFDGLTLAICLSYAVVAVLQMTVTGYVVAEVWLWISVRLNWSAYLSDDKAKSKRYRVGKYFDNPLVTNTSLEETQVNKHKLLKQGEKFVLKTWGILTDDDLNALIAQQNTDDQKRVLAIQGLKRQLDILPLDALRGAESPPEEPHKEFEVDKITPIRPAGTG